MTIMAVMSLCAYLGLMISYIVYNEKFVITETRYMKDLFWDIRDYNFTYSNFDLAFQLSY